MLIPEYASKYLEQLQATGRKASTIKQYAYDLNVFFKWLEASKQDTSADALKSLTKADYMAFLNAQECSADTVRRLANVLDRFNAAIGHNGPGLQKDALAPVKRPLQATDFISDKDFKELITSMRAHSNDSVARDYLMDRNISIVLLIRFYGLSIRDISAISMNQVTFAQKTIFLPNRKIDITLEDDHIKTLLNYYNSIPKDRRPRFRTDDPLFVAFFNKTSSFKINNATGQLQRLSIRAIQKMINEEMARAGIRGKSATQLRNSFILDLLKGDHEPGEIVKYMGFANVFTLHRYIKYATT